VTLLLRLSLEVILGASSPGAVFSRAEFSIPRVTQAKSSRRTIA